MLLSALAEHKVDNDVDISGITADSREVQKGFLFAALRGEKSDGMQFIPQAEKAGAAAILMSVDGVGSVQTLLPIIKDKEPRLRLAQMAARFHPECPRIMAGITGTNGKTSTAHFAAQLWAMGGVKGGSLGTLGAEIREQYGQESRVVKHFHLRHTTPDPVTLHSVLSKSDHAGCTHMAMEVSSHGLAQFRADGVNFDIAAFTNITQDHLDYHDGFEDYFSAKKRLFTDCLKREGVAIINSDGAGADELINDLKKKNRKILTTGAKGNYLRAHKVVPVPGGLSLQISFDEGKIFETTLPLIGAFQSENALLAAAIVTQSGLPMAQALSCLTRLAGVPGRMALAGRLEDAGIYVDYAHTPEAVRTALMAARPHAQGRLIAVIGAGGDRDREKRPLMGRAAHECADYVIITNDNPRTENPDSIRDAVALGAPEAKNIADRAQAIKHGVELLTPGDVLMVLGKGHETGQIIGDDILPFDDMVVVEKMVEQRKIGKR